LFSFVEISDQIRYFWQKTKLTEVDTRLRFFVASLVEGEESIHLNKILNNLGFLEAFGSIFIDTVCLPFGSSVTTFGKSRCDLDMLLTFEDFRDKNVRNEFLGFLFCIETFLSKQNVMEKYNNFVF